MRDNLRHAWVVWNRVISVVINVDFIIIQSFWFFTPDLLIEINLSKAFLRSDRLQIEYISLNVIEFVNYCLRPT